ncbi:MAG: prolyl oligopeptidase family serine peptidase [Aquificaceae bacterium]|nr:prolyl oligopeptidase family serine peptidase [Aquificaceae bacterium]MDW8237323.1 prolyl oligopeptidase family serine peptidase [Aquificaceae bacterium]
MPHIKGVDLPFHGRSNLGYSCPWELARELSFIAPLGSVILGWSMGGVIAIMMKMLFPSRFKRVVIVGGFANMRSCFGEDSLRGFILRLKRRPNELDNFRKTALGRGFNDKIDLNNALKLLSDISKIDLRAKLSGLNLTVLHGINDKIVPPSCGLELANLSGGRFLLLDGGHMPGEIIARSADL